MSQNPPDSTASIDCGRVAVKLPAYLADELPPSERRLVRRHIHQCEACFAKAVASDPAEIFTALAEIDSAAKPDAAPERNWDGFWPAIQEGIRREEHRTRFRSPALLALAAAAAAALVFVMVSAPWRSHVPVPPTTPGESMGTPQLVQQAAPGSLESASLLQDRPLPPTVEQVRTPDPASARIFSMTYYQEPAPGAPAGSSPQPTELVLIVDAGIEL